MISGLISERAGLRLATITIFLATAAQVFAQGGGGGAPAAPPPPKAGAPIDLTGYWVAVVTEDWRFRMMVPPKGDYASVPLNPEGRKVADTWAPGKDTGDDQCKPYGAPGLMRIPGRLHITWENDTTLKLETDAGTQTRLFPFQTPVRPGSAPAKVEAPAGPAGWQGTSAAQWEYGPGGRGANPATLGGSLKVVTRNMKPGYIRKNGVPYSANAVLTEYYSKTQEPNGDSWLIVTSVLDDPTYLNQPFITSTNFKRQADNKGWHPTPCSAE